MPDISVQFHATLDELLTFVRQCVADLGLNLVGISFLPFTATELSAGQLDDSFQKDASYRELSLGIGSPVLPAASRGSFIDNNPDRLHVSVERESPDGLRQMILTARTSDQAALAAWREIGKRLRKITKAGVVAIDPKTGARTVIRTFRYTPGAKALASKGVAMLPIAGGTVLEFP